MSNQPNRNGYHTSAAWRTLTLPGRATRAIMQGNPPRSLGDFTTSPRVVFISLLAVVVGLVGTGVAWALLRLIAFFTNLLFFMRFSTATAEIADAHITPWILVIPVAGGLVIGLMARYGSERIRGHGIPEAIEAILINESRVHPRVAILKPLSSAISIGSGGPFGAEGPIILTGGAFGSLFSQFLHVTNIERRTLLVAGAAAGMSATFAAPVASTLLAVELLLFEWKPRSFIPVAIAAATAATARNYILDAGPLFPVVSHEPPVNPEVFLACLFVGLTAGLLSMALTAAVYAAEDGFHRLPIHWMWWPAIGGVFIGIGGLIFPEALGVGYPVIRDLLTGEAPMRIILGVLIVKSLIWSISLGSGTSGGVLAPLLMIGASMGAMEANFLPFQGEGFWPLVAMGAVMGGTMRSPLTGIVFVLELTHDVDALLPVMIAVVVAHGTTVLFLRRSILTEKVSRRGLHLGREYAPDPLENSLVRQVLNPNPATLPADATPADFAAANLGGDMPTHALYPVVASNGVLKAVITARHLNSLLKAPPEEMAQCRFGDLQDSAPVVAYPGESLRVVADRMADTGHTRLPVVEEGTLKFVGMVGLDDVLDVRVQHLVSERRRERVMAMHRARHHADTSSPTEPPAPPRAGELPSHSTTP